MLKGIIQTVVNFRRGTTREQSGRTRLTSDGGEVSSPPSTQSTLFKCPNCGTVYIAVDKQQCSDCDSTVESIASTLSEAKSERE